MASEKGDLVRAADVFQEIGNESMQSNLGGLVFVFVFVYSMYARTVCMLCMFTKNLILFTIFMFFWRLKISYIWKPILSLYDFKYMYVKYVCMYVCMYVCIIKLI